MRKVFIILAVFLAGSLVFQMDASAARKKRGAARLKHADRNKDGVVDEKERRMEMKKIDLNGDGKIDAKEKRISWLHSRSKVNTAMELKYDTNSDGWIEADEAREMLRHRYRLIKTNGQVKVDSAIEREYDMNGDGVIDRLEAEALKDDLE